MMWGAPGIGKSDIVKQIADQEGRDVIDIRLPLWEPTDYQRYSLLQFTGKQHGLGKSGRVAN